MAIRIARCFRCNADALVCGEAARAATVTAGETVYIDVHQDGEGVSCPGFVGRIHPDYPICSECGGEIVDGLSDLFHAECEPAAKCPECDSPVHTQFDHDRMAGRN